MSQKLQYLHQNPQIGDILAQGFARICQDKPKFPINYLAKYLKNHTVKSDEKVRMQNKQVQNQKQIEFLNQLKQKVKQSQQAQADKKARHEQQKSDFIKKIQQSERHQRVLNYFCQWIASYYRLTGVYIGELEYQTKAVNINEDDSQTAHLELQKQKIIKFKYANQSQRKIVVGRQLGLDSVVGKLVIEAQNEENNNTNEEAGQGQEEVKTEQVKGEVYINSVVGNQQLKFFRFPKLGAYYAIALNIKSYLKQKLFDDNTVKIENYIKVLKQFDKQMDDKNAKFRQAYDEKMNAGVDQKQLDDFQNDFQREKSQIKKPEPQNFDFQLRRFVVCFDTLGLDKTISNQEKQKIRYLISILKQSWQSQQKSQLQHDIQLQLKLLKPQNQQEGTDQIQNFLQQFNSLLEQQQKQIPNNQQVQKVKDNQKLFQLQSNTVRLQKTKQYLADEKYLRFWDHLLQLNVIKYAGIIKQFLIFLGYKKEEFTHEGTNLLDWQKTKNLLRTDRQKIGENIAGVVSRGSKPQYIKPYAKVSRIDKNLSQVQPAGIAGYNMYLTFILRLLKLYIKIRGQDRQSRVLRIATQRQHREQKIKEAQEKVVERKQKLDTYKAELQQKGQIEGFDEEAWNTQFDEENPPVDIPAEILDDVDRDLEQ